MTTLTTPPLATLLPELFAEAEASQHQFRTELAALPAAEREQLLHPDADYHALYSRAKNAYLAISPATGSLLYMLARSTRATAIVEFGMSFGLSTLHLAAALRDNGGGRVITTEFEPSKALRARANFERAGLGDLIEIREGDALETLGRDLPASLDLVLLDGAKPLYPPVLALLEPRLRTGGLIVADNADRSPDYLAEVSDARGRYRTVAFADDVAVSMKLG
ncbi:O-methyltransferase [Paraburkholderia phosphatilytica]|uniref:O-methyltransferase n=1 Tax=Paraburkholderia phosphatilytica TaxID=2282883 RepID=UPI000E4BE831|nr:O-methyltransferase [Paraburkholderia phosphatilytica]